jgi:hypothetical protein
MEELYQKYIDRAAELLAPIADNIKTGDDLLALVFGSVDMFVSNSEGFKSLFAPPISILLNGLSSEQSTQRDSGEDDGKDNQEHKE